MPVYLVTTPQGERLVDATSKAQAINYVTRTTTKAVALTATQLAPMMQAGKAVEKASAEPAA